MQKKDELHHSKNVVTASISAMNKKINCANETVEDYFMINVFSPMFYTLIIIIDSAIIDHFF